MFPGLPERIEKELKALAPPSMSVKVIGSPGRESFTWIGGSILGSDIVFRSSFITKEEYDEEGPSIVHRKFL